VLTEEEKAKAVKTFKLQLNGVFQPFTGYGMKDFIPPAIEQITELSLLLNKRLSGLDIPITFEHANGKLAQRYRKR